jgi:FkbM family methyltransferase
MIRKIKKTLNHYFRGEKNAYLSFEISGVNLRGLKGTFRKKVDQDDAWYFELAKNSAHVFDLGSNIGYMSLIAAIQKNNKSVLLVDPNPEALAKASQNLIINGFGLKSKFISAFIGDIDGEKIKFYTVGSGEAGIMYSSHEETASLVNSFYEVEKLTIDTIVSTLGYIPDLIKIDVEGAEYLALKGAVSTAKSMQSKFFVEMHSSMQLPMIDNANMILSWCKETKYYAYYLKEGVLLNDAQLIAHKSKCHLLLLPETEVYPSYLKNIRQGQALPTSIS